MDPLRTYHGLARSFYLRRKGWWIIGGMGKAADGKSGGKVVGIDVLKDDSENARTIDKEALAGLGYSMEEYGDLSGIVWNEDQGDLVAGHRRMNRLRTAGAKSWVRLSETEGVIAHPKTGESFPIRIVRWPLPKHRAAQIVANNPHIQGEFTEDLAGQLEALEQEGRAAFEALRLDQLAADFQVDDDLGAHSGLEDFDAEPRPRPTWIMVAAPEDLAAEIEGLLRSKFGAEARVRIEKSSNVE